MEEIIEKTKQLFQEINERQIKLGFILLKVAEYLEEDYDAQEQYGTFKMFLADVGKSLKQVTPFINAAKWCEDVGFKEEDIKDIPISKLNLMATLEVPLDDELIYKLKELSYSDLKKTYGNDFDS